MKRIISLVLALLMLSTMSTVAVTSAYADETPTIINGKFFSIGDKIKVTYYVSSDSKWEDFQGNITYDSGLMLEDFSMPNTNTGVIYNTKTAGTIYYSGSSFNNPYDFTTEKVFFTASFMVIGNGENNIENNWDVIDDTNSIPIVIDSVIVDDSRLSCRLEVVPTLIQETTTTESTTEYTTTTISRDTVSETTTEPPKTTIPSEISETKNNTAAPTTSTEKETVIPPIETKTVAPTTVTEETKPIGKSTFNGQPVNVGDKVTVNYYVSSDEKWEDFQGYVTYDSTGVKLTKFTMPNTVTGVMYKTANLGYIRYNGTSYSDPYDFTTEKVFFTAEFTVLEEGDYNVANHWQRIDDINSKIIVSESSEIYEGNRISCRYETLVNSEGPIPTKTSNNTVAPTKATEETKVTETEETKPVGKSTFNGHLVNVGDKVTVLCYATSYPEWVNFQGYVTYDPDGVRLDKFELPNAKTGVMYNTAEKGYVYYSGSSINSYYDFTTERVFFAAEFTVLKEGEYFVDNNWQIITDKDYKTIMDVDAGIIDEGRFYSYLETLVNSEGPIPTETKIEPTTTVTETTIAPTTVTEPSEPILGDTTFNGKKVKVGDLVTVTYYIQTDKMCEDFDIVMSYGTNSVHYDGIELVSFKPGQTRGVVYNTNIFGKIYYNGSSFSNPYDFTEKSALMTATFRIVKEGGQYSTNAIVETLTGVDGTMYATDGKVETPFTWIEETNGVEYTYPTTLPTTTIETSTVADTTVSETTIAPTTATKPSEPIPGDTTFNGKKVKVGDLVKVTYYIQTDKMCEDFQIVMSYGTNSVNYDGIELVSFKPVQTKGTMYNTDEFGKIYYNGSSFTDPYDFTEKSALMTATFRIIKEGGQYSTHARVEVLTGVDGTRYATDGKVETPFTWIEETNGVEYTYPTTLPTTATETKIEPTTTVTETTIAPTTVTEPSEPIPGDTTFNGQKVKVGDLVKVTYYIQTDKMCEDFQIVMSYGTNSVNYDGIELVSFKPVQTKGTMYNTDEFGAIYYNGSSFTNPYDFTEKSALMTATFRIIKEGGQYSTHARVEVLTGVDGTRYATDGKVETPFTWIEETNGVEYTYPTTLPTTTIETSTVADTTVSETTIAPTTATPTYPIGDTTFNGQRVNVGDLVTVTYYIQTDQKCEDFQVYMKYGTTSVNYDGIELVSFTPGETKGAMYNTDEFGSIYYNGSSFNNPYDFTNATPLMTATFRIIKEGGQYYSSGNVEVLTGVDGTRYATDGKVITPFIWVEKYNVISTPTSETSTSTQEETKETETTATEAPTPTAEPTTTVPESETTVTETTTLPVSETTVTETTTVPLTETTPTTQAPTAKPTTEPTTTTEPVTEITTTVTEPTTTEPVTEVTTTVTETTTTTTTTTATVPPTTKPAKVLVSRITLNTKSQTIYTGKTFRLRANVSPSNATNKGVQYISSNKKVATVTSTGYVKGIRPGTAYITVKAKDGSGKYAKCKITVKQQKARAVKLSSKKVNIYEKGGKIKVKATLSPSNVYDKSIKVKSNNTKIIKVITPNIVSGKYATLKAVKKGSTTVKFTAADGSKKYATCKVTAKK